ncbi:MAG: aldehyde dehydrogenase family protein [Ureaplasma sp.]|nr:aldehyde dehydrogenase family protein [Ureaplasma sp.]MDE7221670.1 aldehyde dehydrogenase family protein [Ureaplasma sp.]
MKQYKILVNGQLIDSEKKLQIINSTDNSVAGEVPLFEPKDIVEKTMIAANNAFSEWKHTTFKERKELLLKFKDKLLENKEELANLLCLEIAKSKKEAIVEVERSAEYIVDTINIYEGMIDKPLIIDETIHKVKNKVGKFIMEPLGVVLAISPFNYPINLLISKLAPALITGNTVVYKPATQGSLVGAYISQLFFETNFKPGVVNCVIGQGKEIGDLLVTHPYVKMISFTGSANVGNHIAKLAYKVHLVLEMGGKDPAIVLDDANLDLAASEIVKGGLSYNGQRCTAIKRVFVTKKNHSSLVDKITELTKKLTIGLPENNPNITPLVSSKSADYVMELINDSIKNGAIATTTIKRDGNIVYPVILDNVTKDMRIAWEEPFGPVLPIIEINSFEEAIELSNKSEYGLQASVFTENVELFEKIAIQLECGSVNLNRSSARGPDFFPFLGVKNSGFGVQGLTEAIKSMVNLKGLIYNK